MPSSPTSGSPRENGTQLFASTGGIVEQLCKPRPQFRRKLVERRCFDQSDVDRVAKVRSILVVGRGELHDEPSVELDNLVELRLNGLALSLVRAGGAEPHEK
jgi:hypothetical protein